ncbi:MAG: MSHA biogenesis protein MshJ [Candidatus Azotimanducaceae bacterium]|jgi:MSHA biogenesis protein MshJ
MNFLTYIAAYIDRLEALSLREQLLIGATVIAFLVSMLQILLIGPLLANRDSQTSRLKNINTSIERQARQLEVESPIKTRHALMAAEVDALTQQLAIESENIKSYTSTLVPARQMPALLQSLLEQDAVRLVSLTNLPPVAMIESESQLATGAELQLFRHGIQLQLRGSFHTLRRYLIAIEQQPWKLLWQSVRLETDKKGESVMELQLQTLSTDSAWLGV